MRRLSTIVAGLAMIAALPAVARAEPDATGQWLTESGRGIVEIYPCSEALCGKIVWLREPLTKEGAPVHDRNNPKPELQARPVCGMQIMGGFHRAGSGDWEDGWIYSPENGKTYHAKLKVPDADTLDLRGYVGIPLFGETQHWKRDAAKRPSCAG
jgi:uncharacterized protein (DUF2147 family)